MRFFLKSAAWGLALGALVSLSYTLGSVFFCYGLRFCPNSWVPYVIIFFSLAGGIALAVILFALLIRAIYNRYYRGQV